MSKKNQLSEAEKLKFQQIQMSSDGILRCFISGEVINFKTDDFEYA